MKSPTFSQSELSSLIADSAAAAKPAEMMPTWDDVSHALKAPLRREDDGSVAVDVPIDPTTPEGQRSLGVYAELMTPFHRASANRAAEVRGRQKRVKVQGRVVPIGLAERVDRKFHKSAIRSMVGFGMSGWQYRCAKGHTFGFLKAKPDADRRPCVRDGCDSFGFLERA